MRGGIWGVGGVASDGTDIFVATGNTVNTNGNWGGGEAVIRFQPGPVFSGSTTDYWAPMNWLSLDNEDADIGGSGPILVARKIITDTIQTTMIPKRKRLMMYLFTALHSARLSSRRFLRSSFKL